MTLIGAIIAVLLLVLALASITGRGNTIPVNKILRNLADHFRGAAPRIRITPYMRGCYKQHKFTIAYVFPEGNMGDPYAMYVKLFTEKKSDLCIYLYDRDPGTVLNAKRAVTGDNKFDAEFFVYSNKPDESRRYFNDDSRRATVGALKEQDWHLNYIKGAVVKTTTGNITSDVSPKSIEDVLNNLLSLKI